MLHIRLLIYFFKLHYPMFKLIIFAPTLGGSNRITCIMTNSKWKVNNPLKKREWDNHIALIERKNVQKLISWWYKSKLVCKHTPWFDLKNRRAMLCSSLFVVQHTRCLQIPKRGRILVNKASHMRIALVQVIWWIENWRLFLKSMRLAPM